MAGNVGFDVCIAGYRVRGLRFGQSGTPDGDASLLRKHGPDVKTEDERDFSNRSVLSEGQAECTRCEFRCPSSSRAIRRLEPDGGDAMIRAKRYGYIDATVMECGRLVGGDVWAMLLGYS